MSWVPETTAAESRARTVLIQTAAFLARNGDGTRATAVRDAVDTLTAERNRLAAAWWAPDSAPASEALLAYAEQVEKVVQRYRAVAAELERGR